MPTKEKVNKSAAIRELLSTMGLDASPTDISKRLKSKGITVSPNAVSTIKLEMRKRAASRSKGTQATRSPQSSPKETSTTKTNGHLDVNDVLWIRTLAKKVGADNLHRLVDAVAG